MSDKIIIKRTGMQRILYAFVHSYNGFKWLLKHEAAFKQEVLLFIPLTLLAFWLDVTALERCALILALGFVLFAEMTNSAIEAVVDRIGLDYHELSGVAKNVGSGLVLLSMFMAGFVWLSILILN
ncbi:MAG: diacylglycerol kinase [Vibrio sp.]